MPEKITYLLGAGASANSIPMVNQFTIGLEYLSYTLNKINSLRDEYKINCTETSKELCEDGWSSDDTYMMYDVEDDYRKYFNKLQNDLKWLIGNAKSHASIDTFAKKLTIQNKPDELLRLKQVVIVAFLFFEYSNLYFDGNLFSIRTEGIIRKFFELTDQRYDTFFATVLNNSVDGIPVLPDINILTWNYDLQIERSFREYTSLSDMHEISKTLGVIHTTKSVNSEKNNFNIVKLNGIATAFQETDSGESSILNNIHNKYNSLTSRISLDGSSNNIAQQLSFFIDALRVFRSLTQEEYSSNVKVNLRYAWEDWESKNELNKQAIEISMQTTILVVIGYSFPYFNRVVDQMLFDRMTKLERIVLQSPSDTQQGILESLNAIKPSLTKHMLRSIEDCTRFHIPNELITNKEIPRISVTSRNAFS